MIHLAIESSCDETSCAVLDDRKLIGLSISSQTDIHKEYGGVVPEIASRKHLEAILPMIDEALNKAKINLSELELISVTQGPGLIGALLVGISAAKSLSAALRIPIKAVNHMTGHIAAIYLNYPDLKPPFISLVVSGGHTYLVEVKSFTDFSLIGTTRDDAAGEAFDKVARSIGLPYPGGIEIDKIAKSGNKEAFNFPRVMVKERNYDFSFSGLKTAVINELNKLKKKGYRKEDVAASFQEALCDVLVEKSFRLAEEKKLKTIAMAGGVAANSRLREKMLSEGFERKIKVIYPEPLYCTDNAAMIGVAGYDFYKAEGESSLDFTAKPNLELPTNEGRTA